jgi:hypothetical protein
VIAIRRDVHVGATRDDASRVVDPIVRAGYRGFDPDALIHGDANDVAARFAELRDIGYTDVIVRHLAEDHDSVLQSFDQLARVHEAMSVT